MHVGYLYILFSLASYSSLGVLYKVAEVKGCRAEVVSILMSPWSVALLAAIDLGAGRSLHTPLNVAVLAIPFGMCGGVAVLALQSALSLGNISTSWLAVNLSAGIPTVLSVLLYKERILWWQIVALGGMAVAMVLLWKDSQVRTALTSVPADA